MNFEIMKIHHQDSNVINIFSVNPVISVAVVHETHLKFLTLIYLLTHEHMFAGTHGHSTHTEARELCTSVLPRGLGRLNSRHHT